MKIYKRFGFTPLPLSANLLIPFHYFVILARFGEESIGVRPSNERTSMTEEERRSKEYTSFLEALLG